MHWKMHVRFGKGFVNTINKSPHDVGAEYILKNNNIFRWFTLLFHTVSFISCYKILLDAGTTCYYIICIIVLIDYSLVLSYFYDSNM